MSRFHDAWNLLNLSCRGMTRLASESLDRDLRRSETAALRLHLLVCRPCRRYRAQIILLRRALRSLADRVESDASPPGPALPADVRDRIKRAIRDR